MAQALLLPLIERKYFLPEEVIGVVGKKESIKIVKDKFPQGLTVISSEDSLTNEAWKSPIKILAVKPQQLNDIDVSVKNIEASLLGGDSLIISLLAGVKLSRLHKSFPDFQCVRAVPNAPSLVGAGLTGLAWDEAMPLEQISAVKAIFEPVSEIFHLPENQLDAFLALTSSGPAYVALIVEALADGAVAAGLPRNSAYYLSHRTLAGSALLLKEREMQPSELKDMVASPGGTTIAGLRHLEKERVRSALIESVVLAAERSRDMSS